MGLGVGDALGATTEFRRMEAPAFPALLDGTHTEMKGGGRFSLKPGQVTDDTQMACCLAAALKGASAYDPAAAHREYLAWMPHAFDVGEQTKGALEALKAGAPPELVSREQWIQGARKPAGNGSLMRTAPIGVHFSAAPDPRRLGSFQDSALTHFDPRCQLACAAFNASLAAAIHSRTAPTPSALVAAARTELSVAGASLGRLMPEFVQAVQEAVLHLREDLVLAAADDPQLHGPELHLLAQQGFVRVAFRLAYWELHHAPSFEAALIDVVNRGGDADTNGAITGALLGAQHGEGAIPNRWKTAVMEALSTGRGGPLWDKYHPRILLELVET